MAIQIRRGTDAEWESNNSNIVAGEPAVTLDTGRFFVGTGNGEFVELQKKGNGGDGLTDDVKQALLQIASKVAYIDDDGQDYYDALESALYPDATLVSISAVYTQSGTVYDTDSLDSLKDDLVVTALYSDASTATVTAYTLSGSLTAGTSTITVTYSGKTTTFNVTVTAYLPTGYKKLTCLTMDGSQYITPNIAETDLFTAEYKVSKSNDNADSHCHVLSSANTYYPNMAHNYNDATKPNYFLAKIKGTATYFYDAPWTANVPSVVAFDASNGNVTVDGVSIGTATIGSSANSSNKYYMFAYAGNSGASSHRLVGKCWYIKLWDSNNDLVHEYVPAQRLSDSVNGMYDRVTNTFLTSATGTNFGGEV